MAGAGRGRWVAADAGDLDGDGRPDLVLAAAYLEYLEPQWVAAMGTGERQALAVFRAQGP